MGDRGSVSSVAVLPLLSPLIEKEGGPTLLLCVHAHRRDPVYMAALARWIPSLDLFAKRLRHYCIRSDIAVCVIFGGT